MDGKRAKLSIALVVFVDLLGFGILIPMLPFYVRHFGLGAFELGLLMSVYSVLQIFAAPFWGRLSDRWGRRPVLLLTICGQALAFILAGLAWNYEILFLSRLLAGLFAGNIATASAYMADITSRENRAKGMGLIGAAFGLGFTLGPGLSGLVLPLGYAYPSFLAASLSLLNLMGAFFFLREPEKNQSLRSQNRRKLRLDLVKDLLSRPMTLNVIVVFFLITFAFVHLEINLALFVVDLFSFSETQAVYLLAGFGVLMAIVQGLAVGVSVKKFGEPPVFMGGLVLMLTGLSSMLWVSSSVPLLLGLSFLAIGYSFSNPCLAALLSKSVSSEEQGSFLGLYHSGGSMARAVAPILAGWAYQTSKRLPFAVAFLILLIVAVLWIKRLLKSKV